MLRKREVLQSAPLAWDRDGQPFQLPAGAMAWKVRRYTGKPGRPALVWSRVGPVHLRLEATAMELCCAVDGVPGAYRLYPVDMHGQELEPVAVVEIIDPGAPRSPYACHATERVSNG